MDPRANNSKPFNATQLKAFSDAGIPMLNKPFGDIAHWKGMIFKAQNAVSSPARTTARTSTCKIAITSQYQDESIYFSKETDVVQSLMRQVRRRVDGHQLHVLCEPCYEGALVPTTYTIAPEFNLPPTTATPTGCLPLLNNESTAIDVVMFRITDSRPANALISAVGRGVPVRLYAEPLRVPEHRKAGRLVQRRPHVYGRRAHQDACARRAEPSEDGAAGGPEDHRFRHIQLVDGIGRQPARGELLHRPRTGSSSSSETSSNGNGTTSRSMDRATVQTTEFIPSEPDAPSVRTPANAATGVTPGSVALKWSGNNWGRKSKTSTSASVRTLRLVGSDIELGRRHRRDTSRSLSRRRCPGRRTPGGCVSKTMANVGKAGGLWTFTTSGTPPTNPPPPQPDTTAPTVYVYSPGNNSTVSGTRDVYASATDNVAAVGVQFKLDGVNLKSEDTSAPFRISWDTTTASEGHHTLTAVARDNKGNRTTAEWINVTVDNDGAPPPPSDTTNPTVSISAPANRSTVTGTTTISSTASDNVGVVGVPVQGGRRQPRRRRYVGSVFRLLEYDLLQQRNAYGDGDCPRCRRQCRILDRDCDRLQSGRSNGHHAADLRSRRPPLAHGLRHDNGVGNASGITLAWSVAIQTRWREPRGRGHERAVSRAVEQRPQLRTGRTH